MTAQQELPFPAPADPAMQNLMLDIETLGTERGSFIAQIGCVRFDPFMGERGAINPTEHAFVWHIKVDDPDDYHGSMDLPTVLWWLSQPKEAQQRVFQPVEGAPSGSFVTGWAKFCDWLKDQGPFKRVWTSGNFDLPLLEDAYNRHLSSSSKEAAYPWPFTYRNFRDFRTLKTVGKMMGIEEPLRVGVHHDALDDAFHQAGWAIEILRACRAAGMLRSVQHVSPYTGANSGDQPTPLT